MMNLPMLGTLANGSETIMGENVEHIFVDNGLYEATVTVTDEDGASTTSSLSITVNNVAPIIESLVGSNCPLKWIRWNSLPTLAIPGVLDTHTIIWDFGDGNSASDTLTPSHTYSDDGVYEVTLTITDSDEARSTSTINVTVNNAVPSIASLSRRDTTVDEGDAANFSITARRPRK